MARKVFFSFHYQNDIWRVSQVRNSWLTHRGKTNTFMDAADWESVKKNGSTSIKRWIDRQLSGTSVTVVLIGNETANRKYVMYEIEESYRRGNGLLGVYIHGLKNRNGETSAEGVNPLSLIRTEIDDSFLGLINFRNTVKLSEIFKTYYWFDDDGRANMPDWIEEAAVAAGR